MSEEHPQTYAPDNDGAPLEKAPGFSSEEVARLELAKRRLAWRFRFDESVAATSSSSSLSSSRASLLKTADFDEEKEALPLQSKEADREARAARKVQATAEFFGEVKTAGDLLGTAYYYFDDFDCVGSNCYDDYERPLPTSVVPGNYYAEALCLVPIYENDPRGALAGRAANPRGQPAAEKRDQRGDHRGGRRRGRGGGGAAARADRVGLVLVGRVREAPRRERNADAVGGSRCEYQEQQEHQEQQQQGSSHGRPPRRGQERLLAALSWRRHSGGGASGPLLTRCTRPAAAPMGRGDRRHGDAAALGARGRLRHQVALDLLRAPRSRSAIRHTAAAAAMAPAAGSRRSDGGELWQSEALFRAESAETARRKEAIALRKKEVAAAAAAEAEAALQERKVAMTIAVAGEVKVAKLRQQKRRETWEAAHPKPPTPPLEHKEGDMEGDMEETTDEKYGELPFSMPEMPELPTAPK